MKIAVFDTETTGLLLPKTVPIEKQPKIIEFGIMVLDAGVPVFEGNWLINPGIPLPPEITKITGIKDEDLVGKPAFHEVWPEINNVFIGCDSMLAHNLPFDRGMVENDCLRHGMHWSRPKVGICTVQEYYHKYGRRPKLLELYETFTGKPLAQTHRALDDVKALVEMIQASGLLKQLEGQT